ncbi:MAG: hypothetical protein KA200_00250 [Burkholderiales bacterium]|nr:hypothetical protein [Burkholderiales bacterium]
MPSVATLRAATSSQMTLDFEPSLPDRFASLREYIAHRVQVQPKPAKTIAGDMDLSPSVLSRKLSPGEGDTQRFNVDDLERYIASTGDTAPIEYLVAKYLQTPGARTDRIAQRVELLMGELGQALTELRRA